MLIFLLDIDANIHPGVGEAYPGSTGGEIFNCYEGNNRNVASGDYSKASGEKNQALGNHTVVGGYGNVANHYGEAIFGGNNVGRGQYTFIAGKENKTSSSDTEYTAASIILGTQNQNVSGCVIGAFNNGSTGGATYKNGYLFGQNLSYYNNVDNSYNSSNTVVIGNYNTKTTLIRPSVVLACGQFGNRFNGLELSTTDCKILTNFQLASDATAVNAIDPPQDPANPTTDEQTLATLGSLHNLGITRQEQHYFDTLTDLNTGTGQNITTDLGLTVPDWANEIILHIKIVDSTNFDSPITRRCNVSIPIQPADISATWRGYLNIFHIAIKNSIYSTVYYAGEFYIYQNVLDLENATELKLSEATPPTISFTRSNSSFFLEGMEFKGIY